MRHAVLVVIALSVMIVFALGGCASTNRLDNEVITDNFVYVRMSTTAGDIILELDREHAPISVDNFLAFARRSSYDGTVFQRVIPDFVIQGGGFTGGGAATFIERSKQDAAAGRPDVPIKNEWRNGLLNVRGTIAMARDAEPDTATREFYINVKDNPKLDTARDTTGKAGYAVFGKVIAGMDVVDTIRVAPTKAMPELDMKDVPLDPVTVKSVRRITAQEAGR